MPVVARASCLALLGLFGATLAWSPFHHHGPAEHGYGNQRGPATSVTVTKTKALTVTVGYGDCSPAHIPAPVTVHVTVCSSAAQLSTDSPAPGKNRGSSSLRWNHTTPLLSNQTTAYLPSSALAPTGATPTATESREPTEESSYCGENSSPASTTDTDPKTTMILTVTSSVLITGKASKTSRWHSGPTASGSVDHADRLSTGSDFLWDSSIAAPTFYQPSLTYERTFSSGYLPQERQTGQVATGDCCAASASVSAALSEPTIRTTASNDPILATASQISPTPGGNDPSYPSTTGASPPSSSIHGGFYGGYTPPLPATPSVPFPFTFPGAGNTDVSSAEPAGGSQNTGSAVASQVQPTTLRTRSKPAHAVTTPFGESGAEGGAAATSSSAAERGSYDGGEYGYGGKKGKNRPGHRKAGNA